MTILCSYTFSVVCSACVARPLCLSVLFVDLHAHCYVATQSRCTLLWLLRSWYCMHFISHICRLVGKKTNKCFVSFIKAWNTYSSRSQKLLGKETIYTGEIFWDINFESVPMKHTFDNYCGLKWPYSSLESDMWVNGGCFHYSTFISKRDTFLNVIGDLARHSQHITQSTLLLL